MIVAKISVHLGHHPLKNEPTSKPAFKRNNPESRFKNKLRFLNLKNSVLGVVKVAMRGHDADIKGFKRELTAALSLDPERNQEIRPCNDKFVSHRKSPEPLNWLKSENSQNSVTSRNRAVHLVCSINR